MIKKKLILISVLLTLTLACKKDRLTGDKEILSGTWKTIPVGCSCCTWYWLEDPLYKLDLFEKGKYRLSQNGKKLEDGRLVVVDGFVTFECTSRSSLFNGDKIEEFNSDTLKIDRNCEHDFLYIFVKD